MTDSTGTTNPRYKRGRLVTSGIIYDQTRLDWFKQVACGSHTWPVLGCERCFNKMTNKLEYVCITERSLTND